MLQPSNMFIYILKHFNWLMKQYSVFIDLVFTILHNFCEIVNGDKFNYRATQNCMKTFALPERINKPVATFTLFVCIGDNYEAICIRIKIWSSAVCSFVEDKKVRLLRFGFCPHVVGFNLHSSSIKNLSSSARCASHLILKEKKTKKRKPIKRMAYGGFSRFLLKKYYRQNILPLKKSGGDFFSKTLYNLENP